MLILSLSRRDEARRRKEPVLQMCKNKTKAMFSMAGIWLFPPLLLVLLFPIETGNNKIWACICCWIVEVRIDIFKEMKLESNFSDLVLSFITLIYQCWPVYGRTVGAIGSFSGMERIYWPSRQLRYTSRSLAPFLGQSLALNTRDLCVSLSFGWQLWAKHSSIDLHICNFEEVGATPAYHFFLLSNLGNLGNEAH